MTACRLLHSVSAFFVFPSFHRFPSSSGLTTTASFACASGSSTSWCCGCHLLDSHAAVLGFCGIRLSGGEFTHRSLLSELWRGIYHCCFAPRCKYDLFADHHDIRTEVTCSRGCTPGDPLPEAEFWKRTEANVKKMLRHMKDAHFGQPLKR